VDVALSCSLELIRLSTAAWTTGTVQHIVTTTQTCLRTNSCITVFHSSKK